MRNNKDKYQELKSLVINNDIKSLEKYLTNIDINKVYNNKTLLMIALEAKNVDVTKLLFSKGAKIDSAFIKHIKKNSQLKKIIIHNLTENFNESLDSLRGELIVEELAFLTEEIYKSLINKNTLPSEADLNKAIHKKLLEVLLPDSDKENQDKFEGEYLKLSKKILKKFEKRKIYREDFSRGYKEVIEFLDIMLDILGIFCIIVPSYTSLKSLIIKSLNKQKTVDLITNLCEYIGVVETIDKEVKIKIKNDIDGILKNHHILNDKNSSSRDRSKAHLDIDFEGFDSRNLGIKKGNDDPNITKESFEDKLQKKQSSQELY